MSKLALLIKKVTLASLVCTTFACKNSQLPQRRNVLLGSIGERFGSKEITFLLSRCEGTDAILVSVQDYNDQTKRYFVDQFVEGEDIPFQIDVHLGLDQNWMVLEYKIPPEGRARKAMLNPGDRLFINDGVKYNSSDEVCRPTTFGSGGFDNNKVMAGELIKTIVWTNHE